MSLKFVTKTGNTKTVLTATFKKADGITPVDLSSTNVSSIYFYMTNTSDSSLKITKQAQVLSATEGIAYVEFFSADLSTAGTYQGEFVVTYADTRVESFPNSGYISVIINQSLAN